MKYTVDGSCMETRGRNEMEEKYEVLGQPAAKHCARAGLHEEEEEEEEEDLTGGGGGTNGAAAQLQLTRTHCCTSRRRHIYDMKVAVCLFVFFIY